MECPHDGCGSVVAYNRLHDHELACPHGPCDCTEAGCDFAASPAALIAHLREIHSICVDMIPYGTAMAFIIPVLAPPEPRRPVIFYGNDGTVFVWHTYTQVQPKNGCVLASLSVECVRSAACVWPEYKVSMSSHGKPLLNRSEIGLMLPNYTATILANSTTTPGAAKWSELERSLQWYQPCTELTIWVRIDR
jgi:E3 ubiquitin-protein ligase SIAH1